MILFFWAGCALLAVAFHPLGQGSTGSPGDVFTTLHERIGSKTSAYDEQQ